MSGPSVEIKRKYDKTLKKVRKEFGIREAKDYNGYLKEEKERNAVSFKKFLRERRTKGLTKNSILS